MEQPLLRPDKDGIWLRVIYYRTKDNKPTDQIHITGLFQISTNIVCCLTRERGEHPMNAWYLEEFLGLDPQSLKVYYYIAPETPKYSDATKEDEQEDALKERFEHIG